LLTDLVQIRRLGERDRADNERLRRHLKSHPIAERILRRIAEKVESEIDCRACANCCRRSTVKLSERDIERLSKALRLKPARVIADYTLPSEEEGLILKRDEESGCVFLHGNDCLIYEDRPDICRDYPHLVRGPGQLIARMWHMPERASVCPIAYNTLERYKDESGFVRRA